MQKIVQERYKGGLCDLTTMFNQKPILWSEWIDGWKNSGCNCVSVIWVAWASKTVFFWERLCAMFLTCHDKEFVVSTQTSAFLEVACITPHPQLYPEWQRKHDFLDKGEHIYREKKFLKSVVTHSQLPTLIFFKIPYCTWVCIKSHDGSVKYWW